MSARSPASKHDRILDRVLSFEVLEATYRVALMDAPLDERYSLLTVALREHATEQEATNKTKKTLARVWLNPPPDAACMISWALSNPQEFADRRLMHLGALIATYAYIGGVMGMIGRQLALNEAPTVADLLQRAEGRWGATSTVRGGVGRVVTTLRRLGVLDGGGRQPVTASGSLHASPLASSWLIHATMLTRAVQSIGMNDAGHSPELFWVKQLSPSVDYPLLESHTEGSNRRVLALR
ncbi:MAG: hypothetical protein LC667_04700 [Thioalkalivibrio sp.]|nr:hypothetical protein [Thioalkalivibrio sp.]